MLLSLGAAPAMVTTISTRRFVSLSFLSVFSSKDTAAAAFVPNTLSTHRKTTATFVTSTLPLFMAAPGVQVSDSALIQKALMDQEVTVVDVRGIDEIQANGYWKVQQQGNHIVKWIHAQCTLDACPLLSVASDALLPNKTAPVVLYCASGKRATKAQQVLTSLGYTNVLNAGGFPTDTNKIIQ